MTVKTVMGSVEAVAQVALGLPGTVQGQHFDIPDFRVGGRIFCTARTGEAVAMVKLPQEIQTAVMNRYPEAITPAAGAWGRRGSTLVRTNRVPADLLADLVVSAWRHTAPKSLVAAYLADQERPL
jgi:hypothetical protein